MEEKNIDELLSEEIAAQIKASTISILGIKTFQTF